MTTPNTTARPGVMPLAWELGEGLERLVQLKMGDFPEAWTEAERREAAEKTLFGTPANFETAMRSDRAWFGIHIIRDGERVDPNDFYVTPDAVEVTMTEFTKGPWEASDRGDYADFGGNSSVIVCESMRIAAVHNHGGPEGEANARLIAAAPELFEALKAAQKALDKRGVYGPLMTLIDAALTRAAGGAR